MFHDRARLTAIAGRGGDGSIHFRREKYGPRGGPDGGDGGQGGDVVLRVNPSENTLLRFQYLSRFVAEDGGHGQRAKRHGKRAPDLVLDVPPGTVVRADQTGEVL